MTRADDAFIARQRLRWMRPDAHRWIRPDAARFLAPSTSAAVCPNLSEKYSPDQPRDDVGRWTSGTSPGDKVDAGENIVDGLLEDILAKASKLQLTGSPADYRRCVNLCYPILERFSSPGSDRNYWDYQKCLNACLGLNR